MIKNILVALAGLIGLVYILNPTAGIIELIPDNIPIVGNLDEAAAAALVLAALRYYGVDLTGFLRRKFKDDPDGKKNQDGPPKP
ncbi:MAG: DUF1232 domain-containing protein [Nitrospina sp.]|nr:MAG: DUF1232 domain-containing protein [Nitrospina sp.]